MSGKLAPFGMVTGGAKSALLPYLSLKDFTSPSAR